MAHGAVTGADTFEWIAAARAGNLSAWDDLVAYNEGDDRALRALRRAVAESTQLGATLETSSDDAVDLLV